MALPPRATSEALPRIVESLAPSSRVRLAAAACVALSVILGGPVVGALRGALLQRWPAAYIPVLAGTVGLCGLGLVAFSVLRLRHRSWRRLGAIGLAVAAATSCAAAMRTGDTNVDVVEAFHFTEYAALTLMFAWAVGPLARGAGWAWAGYAAVLVGALDEWLQWFVPGRTGEFRDVAMNAVAAGCGLLLAAALDHGPGPLRRGQASWLARGAALLLLVLAAFVATVHLGYQLNDPATGRFFSRHTSAELAAEARDRAGAWGQGPAPDPGRFGREDQYLSEALWHVRRRNNALDDGVVAAAWREQRILEAYFAPVLRLATEDGPAGHAWSPAQATAVRDAAQGAGHDTGDASPVPIYTWSPRAFWTCTVAGCIGLMALGAMMERRRARRAGQEVHDA